MTPDELGLSEMQVGAHVHALLRIEGKRVELDKRGRARTSPRIGREHALYAWLYDVEKYLKVPCARCTNPAPRSGLREAYWGQWLCVACCEELGKPGGLLDLSSWPALPTEIAA